MTQESGDGPRGMQRLVGKEILLQLRGGDPWMGVCSEDGNPVPIMLKGKDGQPSLMHAPFFQGKLVEYDRPHLLVEYVDQNNSKMLQAFHEEVVAGVTGVLEQASVHIIQPG